MPIPLLEVRLTEDDILRALHTDVTTALTSTPKRIHPRWRWDSRGSELYELINETPEYFSYRTERALLQSIAPELAGLATVDTLIELGSGLSEKTQIIFDAYSKEYGDVEHFIPLDVSISALRQALTALSNRYPNMAIHGLVADFNSDLESACELGGDRRMLLFLGGTVGNLTPPEREHFFGSLRAGLRPGDYFLLGSHLITDIPRMEAAYADSSGLCTEFNRNILRMLNTRLDADFDPEAFEHVARWNDAEGRIEVFLEASRPMDVHVRGLELRTSFAKGEWFQTDVSAKFGSGAMATELSTAGFEITREWVDDEHLHSLLLARKPL
ncbi:L-histidine N(alpha)-methyltransferase [Amycolatopsis vastitatis]|uniref:L-histidine N(Alpha)-methyltransferase n=1 Tax=Amycolatopsis vastitatis TaxID=1905142 RepID=A0A229SK82_9PSEU|nr:L-histidine N(alpha)-methyltransferase [Amycolatopsis vastitatis]OXM59342.1 L-histidine N(alpha)-methyltransferase [Amycolatopsis vastitatis]